MRCSILVGAAFALGALAEPIPNLFRRDTTSCWTRSACEPGPKTLSTTWSTTRGKTTSTKLVTVYSTVTPTLQKTVSITATVTTTTTGPASTLTATSTQTATGTVTVTTTSSLTATLTTSTTSTSTTTVPISSTFVPVQSTLPNSNNRGSGAGPVAKRDLDERDSRDHPPSGKKASYPQGVNCVSYSISTTTATKTITSTVTASTPTVTSSTTLTITTTFFPSATTTVTAQVTTLTSLTQTTSTTVTITTTSTASASATFYAACAPNNLVDSIGSSYIISGDDEAGGYTFLSSNQPSAYDCCVTAYTSPAGNPAHFIYIPSGALGKNCYAYSADTCANQLANTKAVEYSSSSTAAQAWTVGQFQCGTWDTETTFS